jgi:hypothetical protein
MHELADDSAYNGDIWVDNQTYDEMQANGIKGWGTPYSYVYFLSFIVIISLIVMNLSIAAIIDGLKLVKKDDGFVVKGSQIDGLIDLWSEYDPKATGWISVESLAFLIYELPPPLGLGYWMPDYNISQSYADKRKEIEIESSIYRKRYKCGNLIEELEVDGDKYFVHRNKIVIKGRIFMLIWFHCFVL